MPLLEKLKGESNSGVGTRSPFYEPKTAGIFLQGMALAISNVQPPLSKAICSEIRLEACFATSPVYAGHSEKQHTHPSRSNLYSDHDIKQ